MGVPKFSVPSFSGKKASSDKPVLNKKPEATKKTSNGATKFSIPSFGGKKMPNSHVVSNKKPPAAKNTSIGGPKFSLPSFGGKESSKSIGLSSKTEVAVKKIPMKEPLVSKDTSSASKRTITKMSSSTSSVPILYLPELSNTKNVEVIQERRKDGSFSVKMVPKGGSLPKWYK